MKIYVTFGQSHIHRVNGATFDKDSVAVIRADSYEDGSKRAYDLFSGKFCTSYEEQNFGSDNLKYYPRGLVEVDPQFR